MLLESLVKLRFKVDRMSQRERGIVLFVSVFGVLFIWYFLVFSLQQNSLANTALSIIAEQKKAGASREKYKMIDNLRKDDSVSKLVAKYARLETEMKQLEQNLENYEYRYVDDKQLIKFLKSLLEQTPGVSIVGFSNLGIDSPPINQNKNTFSSSPGVDFEVKNGQNVAEYTADPNRYKLKLKGSYFSILDYLKKVEKSKWQLYWDKLEYTVEKYPDGLAIIEFYTLEPFLDEIKVKVGGAP